MCAMREDDVLPRWQYASEDVDLYSRNRAHGHQPKEVGPVRTAHEVLEITLMGCVSMFCGVNAQGDAHSKNNPV